MMPNTKEQLRTCVGRTIKRFVTECSVAQWYGSCYIIHYEFDYISFI
jgi:hypothetical protein